MTRAKPSPSVNPQVASGHQMHLAIAEQGKLFALKGDHIEALAHYREALRLAVSITAPEVFFRHYTQCVLESLELTGAFEEIIRFCTEADLHYQTLDLHGSLHRRDHGSVLERLGLAQLNSNAVGDAQATLERARELAGDGVLPITEEILAWLNSGFRVDSSRIRSCQRRHQYFVVRADQVDKKLARSMSDLRKNPMNHTASQVLA